MRLWLELKFLQKRTQRIQGMCRVLFEVINNNQYCGKSYCASRLITAHCLVSTVTTMLILGCNLSYIFRKKLFLSLYCISPCMASNIRHQVAVSYFIQLAQKAQSFQLLCPPNITYINHSLPIFSQTSAILRSFNQHTEEHVLENLS